MSLPLETLSDGDWACVFAYAGEDTGDGRATIANIPGADVPTTPFTRADVAELFGAVDGERDEDSWRAYGRLHDGRYFYIEAWCDYTGWG